MCSIASFTFRVAQHWPHTVQLMAISIGRCTFQVHLDNRPRLTTLIPTLNSCMYRCSFKLLDIACQLTYLTVSLWTACMIVHVNFINCMLGYSFHPSSQGNYLQLATQLHRYSKSMLMFVCTVDTEIKTPWHLTESQLYIILSDTSLIRTIILVQMVSTLERFHWICVHIWGCWSASPGL